MQVPEPLADPTSVIALFEALELDDALFVLDLARNGPNSHEMDIIVHDMETFARETRIRGTLHPSYAEALGEISRNGVELLARIYYPDSCEW